MFISDPGRIEALLRQHAGVHPLPELERVDLEALRQTAWARTFMEWATPERGPIPQTTWSLFRAFKRQGTRIEYETPYFHKRHMLSKNLFAYWLNGQADLLDPICDLIWSICEETHWLLPAHESYEWHVDLFCAETAAELANATLMLGGALPREIRRRIDDEVNRRVFRPYLAHTPIFGYEIQHSNWTGVCMGAIGEAALLLEPAFELRAALVSHAVTRSVEYIERAFTEDGASGEGISYWGYGLLHFVAFAEMLRVKTGGAIDLLSHPRLPKIARYPSAMYLGGDTFATFADGNPRLSLAPCVVTRLAERTNTPELAALGGFNPDWRYVWRSGTALRDLLWGAMAPQAAPSCGFAVFPDAGVVRCVGEAGGKPLILLAKAGHNAELHNHNDVGAFILHIGNETLLTDTGAGMYTREYFVQETRYESIYCGSHGHSVPIIGDTRQAPGKEFAGTLTVDGERRIGIDFAAAYDCSALRRLQRTIALTTDGIEMSDVVECETPLPVTEVFVTLFDAETDGATARIAGAEGVLHLEVSAGVFRLDKQAILTHNGEQSHTLHRLMLDLPSAERHDVQVTMRYVPRG